MTDKIIDVSGSERGMTGIGVLILFIALVLVAAIASGLILDTAGLLQNTAQNTGEESTAEVSDRLSVLSVSGDVEEVDDLQTLYEESISGADISTANTYGSFNVPEGEHVVAAELNNASVGDVSSDTVSVDLLDSSGTVVDSGSVTVTDTADDYTVEFSMSDLSADENHDIQIGGSSTSFNADLKVVGTDGSSNRVSNIALTVYRSPGADAVDLEHATIEYFGPAGTAFLIHEAEFNALTAQERQEDFASNLGYFDTEAVKDEDSSIPVLNSRDDRASIVVDFYGYPAIRDQPDAMKNLEAGDSATLRLTTQHGATTTQIVNVPESLAGYAGSTVML